MGFITYVDIKYIAVIAERMEGRNGLLYDSYCRP